MMSVVILRHTHMQRVPSSQRNKKIRAQSRKRLHLKILATLLCNLEQREAAI